MYYKTLPDQMAYERIERTERRKIGPTLTIKASGKMRLSAEATIKFRELGAKRIVLLWDKQKHKVALQVAAEHDPGSFSLTYSKTQNSADFGARLIARIIAPESTTSNVDVPLKWNEAERMFEGRVPT